MAVGVVGGVVAAVDVLCAADVAVLADAESIMELHRQHERLTAVLTVASAAFDAGGAWAADGARTGSSWLAGRCSLPISTARRRVRLGRALRHMPVVAEAWLAGEVGESHVEQLAAARTDATQAAFARDEEMLVGHAKELPYRHFLRTLAYWGQMADPDGVEDVAAAVRDGRRLHLSQGLDGTWFLDGVLDPISAAIVESELRRIDDELFRADWAEAKARVGEGVCLADLARTPAQRRADALVEMARRSGALAAGTRLPEPLFTVLVGYETFAGRMCQLANGSVLTPGSLVPWLGEAWVERVVFDGPDRVKNVGVRRRIFTGATRRAVEARDRECFHPLCDADMGHDHQVDHIQPWAMGGLTVDTNGRLACAFHNRDRDRQRSRPPP